MALISLQEITLAFGGPLIFDKLNLQVEPGERIALLGRNGAGKTTLMKVLAGRIKIHNGLVVVQKGIHVAHLPQEVPSGLKGNVFDIVLSGLGRSGSLLIDYHHLAVRLQTEHTPELMKQLGILQSELDRTDSWDVNNQIENIIKHVKLDPESDFEKLSGGQKRRVLLARALALKPEVLLLDEPTANLDMKSREDFLSLLKELKADGKTIVFSSHRLDEVIPFADRIIIMDQGKIIAESTPENIYKHIGKSSQLRIFLSNDLIDTAIGILQKNGFNVSRNGAGIKIKIETDQKILPINALLKSGIEIVDFEYIIEN